ncbi:hypothetical protein DFH09DRAFT_1369364 [Mycena vulgaris]|nr:hypothetical protein DFH09DRAFT_1369364 [Mycena vulgaris]
MLDQDFAGVTHIDDFLKEYMPKPTTEIPGMIDALVKASATKLKAASDAAKKKKKAAGAKPGRDENAVSKPLIEYLEKIVTKFKAKRPLIEDTHNTKFDALDEAHYTKPDIVASQPGIPRPEKWQWHHAGTVFELKHDTDLAKSGRNLLMASRSCVAYTVAVFGFRRARIFRFDRAGFRASSAFDWIEKDTVFPTFFWRLYNPTDSGIRMYGQDETVSFPDDVEKERMYTALCKNDLYKHRFSLPEATQNSLWIKAVRSRTEADGNRVSEVVTCFTIGAPLSNSDGLFSRATLVYRVILKEDAEKEDTPTVYALKDAWRQSCRRPEIDFYDAIAQYCKDNNIDMDKKGMARCHGGVDLSVAQGLNHAPALHKTCSTKDNTAELERCHMRSLLTPVGSPLNEFSSTKVLAQALRAAVLHHQTAYKAGVLHRDVSEGNILFDEATTDTGKEPKGFLNFMKNFPERVEANVDVAKSLKDMTGTFPFMAIEVMGNTSTHGPHHDLESVYWLLIWMVLRHTKHTHSAGSLACNKLFDPADNDMKIAWLQKSTPIDHANVAFYFLVNSLRNAVRFQNPAVQEPGPIDADFPLPAANPVPVPKKLTHEEVLDAFTRTLNSTKWPDSDPAIRFEVPSSEPAKNEAKAGSARNSYRSAAKRALEIDDSQAIGSEGTAVGSDGGSRSKKAKTETVTADTSQTTETASQGQAPRRGTRKTKARS